jgi:2-dehydro-3-deoxygalactonokinase
VLRARDSGGLLHHMFGVRARGLFDDLSDDESAAYLSGLLIGHELAAIPRLTGAVYLLGAPQLTHLYAEALKSYGVDAGILDADAALRGLFKLADTLPRT